MFSTLFEQFLQERRYLKNSSEKTIRFYTQSWSAFNRYVSPDSQLTKVTLNEFVLRMRQSGLSPTSCNVYIRGMNSFLSWLKENEYTQEHLKIKQLKEEKKVLETFEERQIKKIIAWKPSGFYQWRLYSLLCLIIDTGIRIEEALTLSRSKVDFD